MSEEAEEEKRTESRIAGAGGTGQVGDLTDEQNEKLELFRTAVDDILRPEYDDYYLLRWLRARKFDVVGAETMLRRHLQWKQHLQVDTIIDEFDPPEVLRKYYPGGLVGHDKQGCPVWIVPLGSLDIKGLLHSAKKTDFVRYTVKCLQESEEDMKIQSERLGIVVDTHSFILDMENFSMKQLAWKPAVDIVTSLVTLFEDHYPERLKKVYVINAPKYFPLAYSLIKPFLAEETAAKIFVYSILNWKGKLLQDIDPSELPVHWGGTKVDLIDRNPKCPSLVTPGGLVPCSYYTAPSRRFSIDQQLDTIVVEKKTFQTIEIKVDEPGTMLKWEFKTTENDIGFSLYRQRNIEELSGPHSGDDEDDVVPYARVNSHLVPEDGMVVVEKIGRYIFKFDNTYSWYRSKRVFYKIEKIEPKDRPSSAASMRRKKMQEFNHSAHQSGKTEVDPETKKEEEEVDLK